ncbi:MAG: lipopolysaccharide biosynthesis protein RfbH [Leptospiraceae bacterium]|nr:lipopolysaccharide biosynthesis protein RfbH [Leptospiraceae bacterium]
MNENYLRGKLFRIKNSKDSNSSQIALLISEKNSQNNVQGIYTKENSSQNSIELNKDNLISDKQTSTLFINPEEIVLIGIDSIEEELGKISVELSDKIYRTIILQFTESHYQTVHRVKNEQKFVPEVSRVNYAGRIFDEKEVVRLVDSSLDFWLTTGKNAVEFEEKFSEFLSVKNTLLVNSGSSANLVAFQTLTSPVLKERQIRKGDEVIAVAAGFPTTIVPIIQYGAVPVFIDIEIPTYNIDTSKIEEAITNKTKAIMLAHTLGNPYDLQTIKDICDKHNLWLVEDNCDALGSKFLYNGEWQYTGTIGDIGTSSFYPPHHMTMGEGGAVYMKSNKLKKIAESIRDWGRDCWCPSGKDDTCGKRFNWDLGELPKGYDHKYIYSHLGYNLKLTDMQAAVGIAQLEKLPSFVDARKRNWKILREGLDHLSEFLILPEPTKNSDPSWFGFLMTIREGAPFERKELVNFLENKKIQTRMLFAGNFLRQPAFNEYRNDPTAYRVIGELKNTDMIMNQSFWLGVFPGMRTEMLEYTIESIGSFIKSK